MLIMQTLAGWTRMFVRSPMRSVYKCNCWMFLV